MDDSNLKHSYDSQLSRNMYSGNTHENNDLIQTKEIFIIQQNKKSKSNLKQEKIQFKAISKTIIIVIIVIIISLSFF